jgi:hypothetical protein
MVQLNERAVLVHLGISQWTARRFDREVSKEVARSKNVDETVGRYNKSLLPANDYLRDVVSKTSAIRTWFYEQTLPWGMDGQMILPTANFLEFTRQFDLHKSEWENLVDRFVHEYPRLVHEAQNTLGAMFKSEDYPDVTDIRRRFRITMTVLPVPSAQDFRVHLSSEQMERIQKQITEQVAEAQALAVRDVWKRLYDRVSKMAERLKDPEAQFRNSLVENIAELIDLLPRLNLTDDPNLEAMRREVEDKLICDPQTLRDYTTVRQSVADDAQAILDAMAPFMAAA